MYCCIFCAAKATLSLVVAYPPAEKVKRFLAKILKYAFCKAGISGVCEEVDRKNHRLNQPLFCCYHEIFYYVESKCYENAFFKYKVDRKTVVCAKIYTRKVWILENLRGENYEKYK